MFETAFSVANALALAGWLGLLAAPRVRWVNWWGAGICIPAVLSLGYLALMLTQWQPGRGGFSSLAQVAQLFEVPGVLLAGWVHYLAFDLFIGAWLARRAAEWRMNRWFLSVCLVLTFLVGPVGWLLFVALNRGRGEIVGEVVERRAARANAVPASQGS